MFDDHTTTTIQTRRLARVSVHKSIWMITSTGSYTDVGGTTTRTLRSYALLEPPVEVVAALTNAAGGIAVNGSSLVSGQDAALAGACAVTSTTIGGALAAGAIAYGGTSLRGTPITTPLSSYASVVSTLGSRWDVLTSADVTPTYQNQWPSFGSLPSTNYPVTRYTGNLTLASGTSGRGTLIVGGTLSLGTNFLWDGIIIAGRLNFGSASNQVIRGLVVSGMDATAGSLVVPSGVNIQYNRCNVANAAAALGHLERLTSSTWMTY
jgi:hypothetical protein